MAQLDLDFFYGDITIAQISDTVVSKVVNTYINKYEETYLKLLLGESLHTAYTEGMAVTLADREERWTKLDEKIYRIKNPGSANEVKVSPVANYVYFYYQRSIATQTTGTGEKIMEAENATNAGNAVKSKLAWNDMVRMNLDIIRFIKSKPADYGEYWQEPAYDTSSEEAYQLYLDRIALLKITQPFF